MGAKVHGGAQTPPISPREAAAGAVRVGEPGFVGEELWWLTSHPDAPGSQVLVSGAAGEVPRRRSPEGLSVRSRLFVYGAASWCATPHGAVGVDAASQQLVLLDGATAVVVDQEGPPRRTGDPASVPGTAWVIVVTEPAEADGPRSLCAVDLTTSRRVELARDDGFLAEPTVDATGTRVAWLRWPPRTVPWDAAELWTARLSVHERGVALVDARRTDGGPCGSVGQPTWLGDGSLAYVAEGAGFWQPYVIDPRGAARRLCARRAEFQRPRWTTCRWLGPLDDGALACAYVAQGREHVGVISADGDLAELDQPCVRVDGLCARGRRVGWVGATTSAQGAVFVATVDGGAVACTPRAPTTRRTVAPAHFAFTHEGVVLEGAYWAPGPVVDAPALPPLVVAVHPGPTGAVDVAYAPIVDLLTSHGFAVASVDYSGSTGHGRAHRERLNGRYGELDVAECVAAARHLASEGLADAAATYLRGTSSGGTTALLALAGGDIAGAVAWYPAGDFHDEASGFEAGYLERLCGPDAGPRSPLARARAGELSGRALIVQGLDDPVIDPAATRVLVEAMRAAGCEVELLELAGEGHGLRSEDARAAALTAELAFYAAGSLRGAGREGRYDAGEAAGP